MTGHFSTHKWADVDASDMAAHAADLNDRAAKMIASGDLPAEFRRDCWTLGDVRRAVEAAEKRNADRQASHAIGAKFPISDERGDELADEFCNPDPRTPEQRGQDADAADYQATIANLLP